MGGVKNLPRLLGKYNSGWVSISKNYDKVLAYGRTLDSLVKKLQRAKKGEGYITRASGDYSRYVGS